MVKYGSAINNPYFRPGLVKLRAQQTAGAGNQLSAAQKQWLENGWTNCPIDGPSTRWVPGNAACFSRKCEAFVPQRSFPSIWLWQLVTVQCFNELAGVIYANVRVNSTGAPHAVPANTHLRVFMKCHIPEPVAPGAKRPSRKNKAKAETNRKK